MITRPTRARIPLSLAAALTVILAVAPLVATTTATASPDRPDRPGLQERQVPEKPDHATVPEGASHRKLHLKFVEGTDFRLRGVRFVSSDAEAERAVADALAPFPGVHAERLFSRPEAALARENARVERESGREQADKNLWYRLRLPPRVSAVAVMDALNALDVVEISYSEPLPAPPPVTPDYEPDQNYRNPATDGMDVDFARTVPGGRGSNVRVIDIEYSWNTNHEDLSEARDAGASVNNGTPTDPFDNNDHGTAVLGELVADDNGTGVTGIADQADVGMTNASNTQDGYDLADSIDTAHNALAEGDVMLLEQQTRGANGGCDDDGQTGCVAVEYVQAWYDAIVSATSDGIIVVEAAGNGNQDLDADEYDATFGTRDDSGAIIVGAGENCAGETPHNRTDTSTFGSRVNLHGYGRCVVTTGYGLLQGSSESNDAYTHRFSGTSSASPMVAGAAAILSSVAQQQGDADGLTSTQARLLLTVGATPQYTGTDSRSGNIGPMPDLGDALSLWVPSVTVADEATQEGTDVQLTASGSDLQSPFGLSYAWDLDDDGQFDDATGSTATFTDVGQDGTYPVAVRVTDTGGASSTDTATVTVTNVAPSLLNLANNGPVSEGSVLTQTGTIADPGWLESLSLSIGWGDGGSDSFAAGQENTRPDATANFSRGHRYGDNAAYGIEVCGYDDDTSTCANTSAQITNVAPTVIIDPGQVTSIDEGATLSAAAAFSDPGWLDTYTADIDWGTGDGFEPVTPTVTTEGSAGTPDQGTTSGSHTYGDNGSFQVTVRVTDDDGGVGQASFVVNVGNVNPTSTIDLSGAQEINGQQTILAHAGELLTFTGDATDPGSDDLAVSWDWDDGLPSPDVTTTYLVNPPNPDPFPSPTVQPRAVTDSQDHAFADACMYLVTMATTDDDGGISSDNVNVIITGNADARRGAGYWYDQYRGKKDNKNALSPELLHCYLQIVDYVSDVFDESVDASTQPLATAVLHGRGPAPPPQLHRELLTAWLNFANGSIALDEQVDTNQDKVADTAFIDVLLAAESVALDPGATDDEILATKDVLERINLGQA